MTDQKLRLIAAALALAGLAIAVYLTFVHYDHSSPVCVGGGGGCEKVQTSDYAELAGVSEPALRQLMTPQYAGQDYLLENYRFLQAVAAERPAFPDFDAAVYAHRIVDAIYASAREGRPMEVNA